MQFVDALAPNRGRHLIDQSVKIEVLEYGQPVVDAWFLKHQAQILASLARLPDHVETGQRDGAGVRSQDGAEDVDERRLARPVWPKQCEQLVRPYRQADSIEREGAAIALRQPIQADDQVGRLSGSRRYAVRAIH